MNRATHERLFRRGVCELGWLPAIAAVLLILLPAPGAFAQNDDLKPLLDRLERLERDVRTLNVQIARGGSAAPAPQSPGAPAQEIPGGFAARFEVRLATLEEEVRTATGRNEELNHRLDQITKRLNKLVSDIDFRLTALESKAARPRVAAAAPGVPPVRAAPSPPAVHKVVPGAAKPGVLGTVSGSDLKAIRPPRQPSPSTAAPSKKVAAAPTGTSKILPKGTAKERFKFAFDLLRKRKEVEAIEAFKEFLKVHGDSPLAQNAQFWLASTYYVRKDYELAARNFLDVYEKNPKGSKAPDSLLKLGMSLGKLGKKKEACATFAKLNRDFPKASASIKKNLARQMDADGCH